MAQHSFYKLVEPGRIGSLTTRNRIVFPPMATNLATPDGGVSERLIRYYQRRAKGGAGLITIEATYIMDDGGIGRSVPNVLGIYKDSQIAGLSELVDAIHDFGSRIAIQPQHAGRQALHSHPVSISDIPCGHYGTPVRKLSISELEEIEDAFAEAAYRAKRAGFDAVNLHFANGYLPWQSLSPKFNNRNDIYGGTFERRLMLCLNIIRKTRKKVGEDFPLYCRMSTQEFVDGGLTVEDTALIAKEFEKAGLDAIDLNNGIRESVFHTIPPACLPRGFAADLAAEVKKAVNIPVFIAGRINDPFVAEKILEEGKADFVSMGRALIADPDLPRKVMEGRTDLIRPCIACNLGCRRRVLTEGRSIRCSVNPMAGREIELEPLPKAAEPKKVCIIGGGPAGLEAAVTAAKRGHSVELYERESKLGGLLHIGSVPPHKEELLNIVNYYEAELRELPDVTVHLGEEFAPSRVSESQCDVTVVAVGSDPVIPPVPGCDRAEVYTAHQVLSGTTVRGERVVVVGGGSTGCETAEYLAKQGKRVRIIEMLDDVAIGEDTAVKYCLLKRLGELGVEIDCGLKLQEITDKEVIALERKTLELKHIEADSVVLALGVRSKRAFLEGIPEELKGSLIVIGDACEPGRILEAISSGHHAARAI